MDPCSIEDYIAIGGYSALAKTIGKVDPENDHQRDQGLGPAGTRRRRVSHGTQMGGMRSRRRDEKYVICNADEGDPGAYMDRCVLEGNPHLVIEGMMIGAWAVGARRATSMSAMNIRWP